MKKKLFLIALPAFMALSSCSGLNIQPKQNGVEYFKESTVNEEVFGVAEEIGDLGFKKASPAKLAAMTSDFAKVGYQIKFNNGGTTDDPGDDLLSVRFVAAIKDAGVTAVWKRGLAQPNGYEGAETSPSVWKFKFTDAGKESKKIYSSLTDGANVITAGTGDFVGYAGFVVYTLSNIPYSEFSESYLAAYVTFTDESDAENTLKSKGLALFLQKDVDNEARLANEFCFNPDSTSHFLSGTIGGVLKDGSDDEDHALVKEDPSVVDSSKNYASFSNIGLNNTDTFGVFYYSSSPAHFQFFGYNSFFGNSHGFFEESTEISQHAIPFEIGNYNLYIKNSNNPAEENYVCAYANSFATEPTDVFFTPGLWDADGAIFRMYCWGTEPDVWVAPTGVPYDTGSGKVYRFVLDIEHYNSFKFVRLDPKQPDNWDGKWNETADINDFFHANGSRSAVSITGWGEYQITH